ncbi:MAG: polyphosphate kinase 2 family protein [Candidatus Schekmanbacteria bacterium]|nr:polyphosphate kinase 2 family protein [Candidatus Schekmanbacteria bacterium]
MSTCYAAVNSPYLVPFDGTFRIGKAPSAPSTKKDTEKELKKQLEELVEEMSELQARLYAQDSHALLLIFQALDAAGKDGTIRAVMSGINPAGCQVYSFKQPSAEELDHDFLWRTCKCLPERGRIGIFNRSYYEEVLVVRVHPEYLDAQKLGRAVDMDAIWDERFESIRHHEQHLARNGTAVIKFWLNVSKEEQRERFLSRLQEPEKNWKMALGDVAERGHWKKYMRAYEEALSATSRSWAPWYAIPADNKPYMRVQVAKIIVDSLHTLPLRWPAVDDGVRARFDDVRKALESEE